MTDRQWAKIEDIPEPKLTPMLRQYIEAKSGSGDSLLFFRMGDFFELFFEDAIDAAELIGLTLTSRDGAGKEKPIPMAGVPVRSLDSYIARVIKAGRTVAICDQVEDPKEAKGIVKRELVRTITPGTVLEPDLLEDRANNYLGALLCQNGSAGLALLDVTTGEFLTAQVDTLPEQTLADELTRTSPVEVLVADGIEGRVLERLQDRFDGIAFTLRPEHEFDAGHCAELLKGQFDLATVKGLGLDDAPHALACAGAVLSYVQETQRDAVPHLRMPRRYSPSGFVVLDGNTQRNLELVESLLDKRRKGTLLDVLDRTHTHMGARKMRRWILHPLLDAQEIQARLDAVEALHDDGESRLTFKDYLKPIADLERLLGRITSKSGNARDVKALGVSLAQAPLLKEALAPFQPKLLAELHDDIDPLHDVCSWIEQAIQDQPPVTLLEGNVIRDNYDEELDRLRTLVTGGRDWIATLQREESARTGIPKLKVGYNKVFGYYIEISKANSHLAPPEYERKQTLVNAERYIIPALKEREVEIVDAEERMQKREYELFTALRERIAAEANRVHQTADAIATVDVILSFAELAVTQNYTKPTIDTGDELRIRDGRHPVVEHLMKAGEFVPNDIVLDPLDASLHIVTGPNMAGKSTYLRQVALITLMGQIGCFVPAAEARIGVVDRIFTRVGASDNLARGESTFMVEMIETANILNTATSQSLIVLDEIGRGTSTFDGISIAWSVAEHIHNTLGAKTLFATHYHELSELGKQLERGKNVNVAVREWGGKVVFLYRIAEGGADHSYGIQVAKLAGLPNEVIHRAHEILDHLESGNTAALGIPEQMYLFGPQRPAKDSAVEKELQRVDPDTLSPKDAHELIYHLKKLLDDASDG
jgi:DNA mismatch repair protein MutS